MTTRTDTLLSRLALAALLVAFGLATTARAQSCEGTDNCLTVQPADVETVPAQVEPLAALVTSQTETDRTAFDNYTDCRLTEDMQIEVDPEAPTARSEALREKLHQRAALGTLEREIQPALSWGHRGNSSGFVFRGRRKV